MNVALPMGILLELTHRCPLQCPYCSNPLVLRKSSEEICTDTWKSVIEQAADLGVLQVHFSGGEPTVRHDLIELIKKAVDVELYTNLITSGILLNEDKIAELKDAKLDHLQLSFQDIDPLNADSISNFKGSHKRKLEVAKLIKKYGIALTLNFVLHRSNLQDISAMISFAEELEVQRVEIAHTQYYGWGLLNKDFLLPTFEQIMQANAAVDDAQKRLLGKMRIDYVLPDLNALYPKKCMDGWGKRFINVTPNGNVLPCHAAETLPNIKWPSVKTASLKDIWFESDAFNRFRGVEWMQEPCKSCSLREIDFGGCRCQAYALVGDENATDPACSLSPIRNKTTSRDPEVAFDGKISYRRIGVFT